MESRSWKDELARAVFEWQCHANNQPQRAPGWRAAADIAYSFFSDGGAAGSCLQLAAELEGPVGKMWTWKEGGFAGPTTPEFVGSKTPWQVLTKLYAAIVAIKPALADNGFYGPRFAAQLAANQVHQVAVNYACPHTKRSYYYEPGDGETGEPPFEGKKCDRCGTLMATAAEEGGAR